MDADTKYKRWGWGAVIGLIGVILIAGLIVATTMSSPKPTAVEADANTTSVSGEIAAGDHKDGEATDSEAGKTEESGATEEQKAAEKKAAEEKAAREKAEAEAKAAEDAKKKAAEQEKKNSNSTNGSAASDTNKMPKTGPEDNLISILALAVIAGLAVYNISLKRQA